MDLNMTVLVGSLAAVPEWSEGTRANGATWTSVRALLTVKSNAPRPRVDVIPVTMWDPVNSDSLAELEVGDRVFVVGAVQRRFWTHTDGRRSRLEVVATEMLKKEDDDVQPM